MSDPTTKWEQLEEEEDDAMSITKMELGESRSVSRLSYMDCIIVILIAAPRF